MINDDLIDYFDHWFEYGKTFLEWKDMRFGSGESNKWPHQIWWTTQSRNSTRIKKYPLSDMPLDMKILYNEKAGKGNEIKEPIKNEK